MSSCVSFQEPDDFFGGFGVESVHFKIARIVVDGDHIFSHGLTVIGWQMSGSLACVDGWLLQTSQQAMYSCMSLFIPGQYRASFALPRQPWMPMRLA